MTATTAESSLIRLSSASGLTAEINANGSLRRLRCGQVSLSLFVGSEIEGGPTNLYLRHLGPPLETTSLLGPRSPTRFFARPSADGMLGSGTWRGIEYRIGLHLRADAPGWFWTVRLSNTTSADQTLDLTYVQDLALTPYGAVRMNEYYVSQYIDHTPLHHEQRGLMIASRQNQAVEARYPWSLIGALRTGASFATDALQWYGRAARADGPIPGLSGDLPSRRLQHEHSMVVIRDAPLHLSPGQSLDGGFFGIYVADHPQASSAADVVRLDDALRAAPPPEPVMKPTTAAATATSASSAASGSAAATDTAAPASATLFTAARLLDALELEEAALHALFPGPWRHEERDERGGRLSFFHDADRHVVLRAKELRVLRPHGQLLRTGLHLTPDESALTSTVWMGGVFHSMVAQGHVSINRFLSAVHGYLGLFRGQGQRAFVELAGEWHLLGVPSAFEMAPDACRWIYRHEHGVFEVRSGVQHDPHALTLSIEVRAGAPARFLIAHHVALNGDDGAMAGSVRWQREREGDELLLRPAAASDLARRFPGGAFSIGPQGQTRFERVGGDELLFLDGRSREQPYLCIVTAPATHTQLRIQGRLIEAPASAPERGRSQADLTAVLTLQVPAMSPLATAATALAEIAPWFAQNAWVHYLSPRGLEQYSGGGWGTRDVCQGPVELLLALGYTRPVRDLLLRVLAQQNPDGDWPQWFMFFDREREIRAADAHGDVVLWPLVVLAQYLSASGDAALLEERVGFFAADPAACEQATVWQHAQRALGRIEQRLIAGTALLAYGHGDWNDSLQPVDPRMREHLCSAWTVTLHVQALNSLARALRSIGRERDAAPLEARAASVQADFQRLLLVDGVLAGYAQFEEGGAVSPLLHPRDDLTGVHYSALAMIHAILEDLLTPSQAREHLGLIETHLSGADGARLFDRPMPYRGGPQRLFQRAESATFFGREIGLMYMHAHLRYAQALAHLGEAERFFHALCQSNPIGLRALVPNATLRQANCYYSSSDAAFDDRYQASAHYAQVRAGSVPVDGGWRVYSSGAGIALGLIMRHFLGLSIEAHGLRVDPVIPAALDGLTAQSRLLGRPIEVHYRIGSAGCGVRALRLNGATLSFGIEDNPHRRGAARIACEPLRTALRTGPNRLDIELG